VLLSIMIRMTIIILCIFVSVLVYANWPITPLPDGTRTDSVVVYKSARKLLLMHDKKMIKQYAISLGTNPIGAKLQEGDKRTPEGTYVIDYRLPNSSFHYALHISYPGIHDKESTAERGVLPGGNIMIHGIRNGLGFVGRLHRFVDWTNGCIAVTNTEIEEIARVVPDGTPITIYE